MHHFAYRDGVLHAEGVDLRRLAEGVGTPFYCYSSATLERHYKVFAEAFADTDALVCYAMKANSNQAGLRTLGRLGAGMDIVSEGELRRALAAGVPGMRAPVSIRINPDVDAKTHAKISTGKSENKFGIPLARAREVYARAAALKGIEITGVDMHIGSQITDLSPFDNATALLSELARDLMADGHKLHHIDLGGGLGVPYRENNEPPPDPQAYAAIIKRHTKDLGLKLVFEMGRLIAGNAGVLIARVTYVKQGADKPFVIVDAAMNDLIRPTLYEAHHDIKPVMEASPDTPRIIPDVVG